jgi:CBS domain-containing protein
MEPFIYLSQGIKGLTIRIPFKQLAINDPKYSEIYLNCAEAFLILSKLRTVEGLKNEDSGQFINLEELSKIDKENALAPMRELEELIKK